MMTNVRMRVVETVLAATILMVAGTAGAVPQGTIEIEHDGFGAKGQMKVWGGGLSGTTVVGGVYLLDSSNGTEFGEIFGESTLGAMCVELTQLAPSQERLYDIKSVADLPRPSSFLGGSGMGSQKELSIRELWGRYYDPSWAEGSSHTAKQNAEAEAFAAAVWEIVYEQLPACSSSWDVSQDGTPGDLGFRATNLDAGLANTWLHSLDGTGPMADLAGFTNCQYQDFAVEVPEPTTMAMLGIGGLSLLRSRRRRSC